MESGLILLNKKTGVTSFDALRDIKRTLKTGKVGHTGTLDKFAQGLLIVLTGRALKLSRWFSHCDKKYEGKIHFGIETDTLDPEGEVRAEAALPSREKVEEAFYYFTGDIMQTPPAYSAIHVNGQRASSLAREGKTPEMKERPVTIYKLELLSWDPPFADIFVHCSSGTYIRSLARDIALAAGSRAHLCELVRTQVAGFRLDSKLTHTETSHSFEMHREDNNEFNLCPIDKSVISALGMPWIEVTEAEAENIFHGKPLDRIFEKNPLISHGASVAQGTRRGKDEGESVAIFLGDTLIAVVEKVDSKWKYACVIQE
jgi:tRNA pseudouridine55 synthase